MSPTNLLDDHFEISHVLLETYRVFVVFDSQSSRFKIGTENGQWSEHQTRSRRDRDGQL